MLRIVLQRDLAAVAGQAIAVVEPRLATAHPARPVRAGRGRVLRLANHAAAPAVFHVRLEGSLAPVPSIAVAIAVVRVARVHHARISNARHRPVHVRMDARFSTRAAIAQRIELLFTERLRVSVAFTVPRVALTRAAHPIDTRRHGIQRFRTLNVAAPAVVRVGVRHDLAPVRRGAVQVEVAVAISWQTRERAAGTVHALCRCGRLVARMPASVAVFRIARRIRFAAIPNVRVAILEGARARANYACTACTTASRRMCGVARRSAAVAIGGRVGRRFATVAAVAIAVGEVRVARRERARSKVANAAAMIGELTRVIAGPAVLGILKRLATVRGRAIEVFVVALNRAALAAAANRRRVGEVGAMVVAAPAIQRVIGGVYFAAVVGILVAIGIAGLTVLHARPCPARRARRVGADGARAVAVSAMDERRERRLATVRRVAIAIAPVVGTELRNANAIDARRCRRVRQRASVEARAAVRRVRRDVDLAPVVGDTIAVVMARVADDRARRARPAAIGTRLVAILFAIGTRGAHTRSFAGNAAIDATH